MPAAPNLGDPFRHAERHRPSGSRNPAFPGGEAPAVRALGKIVIANICGSSLEEYGELSRILDQAEGVSAIEVNISCPNVAEGGIEFGCDPDMAARATEVVRRARGFR